MVSDIRGSEALIILVSPFFGVNFLVSALNSGRVEQSCTCTSIIIAIVVLYCARFNDTIIKARATCLIFDDKIYIGYYEHNV